MITGGAISTVFYNLRLRHPTLDIPMIDYDLVLLNQPVIILGISIGVVLSVVFADWMITVLLIIIFIGNTGLFKFQVHLKFPLSNYNIVVDLLCY
jgi:hypothetical protein